MTTIASTLGRRLRAERAASSRNAIESGLVRVQAALETWRARARTRRQLMSLDDATLKDIGLGRSQAYTEYSKPFWRP